MSALVLRRVKGAMLTHDEVDDNFENLNDDLVAAEAAIAAGPLTVRDAGTIVNPVKLIIIAGGPTVVDSGAGAATIVFGSAAAAAASSFQPIDSDLTSIAALTTTPFGRGLLEIANAAAARAAIGAGTGDGTVTAVSVTTANGISGSSSGGATPALTLTLGDITPGNVSATGWLATANYIYAGTINSIPGRVYFAGASSGQALLEAPAAAGSAVLTLPGVTGNLLGSSAVNSVSPTSPNRTITVNIGGTDYYLHAKTTND